MRRHLLLTIQYRGTRYHGFQVQKNALSVAQVLQDAVERVFGERLDVKGCSRTDAGVHANRFALTLRTNASIPGIAVTRAINVNLPDDIAVLECREVPEDFHPRYSCRGKRYVYKIWNYPVKNVFLSDLALHWKYPLDVSLMNGSARDFLGTHDFMAFCSAGGKREDTARTITDVAVTRAGDMVEFSVTGNGFLYNMVRIMTGTLLEISRGGIAPDSIPEILASRNRAMAGPTVPPHGLYLDAIYYDFGELSESSREPAAGFPR